MSADSLAPIVRFVDAFEKKDAAAVLACFSEDARVIDPHYPTPEMQGHEQIAEGLAWAFAVMEQPAFELVRSWQEGRSGALLVRAHHQMRGGETLDAEQVFLYELDEEERIRRLQAFVPGL